MFDDMIADMESNKKLNTIATELFLRGGKIYKEYTTESFSFLVNDITLLSITHDGLEITYYKMSIREKIQKINSKIEQNKSQYNLDRQTPKISALSSGYVSKYEFLTNKYVLREKDLLEKAAKMKRF